MAQLIFNIKYQKGKSKTKASSHLLEYMAKREGVEKLPEMSKMLSYMGERPMTEKISTHGLFSDDGKEVHLYSEMAKIDNYDGNIYTAVVSLLREDADRLCFNSANAWMPTIRAQMINIASVMKVPADDLEWFAAYHDHPEHPHCHIMFYSKSGKAWLTKKGIDSIKSSFAKDVLAQDLIQLYSEKTRLRDDLKTYTREYMDSLVKNSYHSNTQIENLFLQLSKELKNVSGKKSYGYLKPELKKKVDEIFSELAQDKNIEKLYSGWCEVQAKIIKSYKLNPDELPPLINQKEFHNIRNQIIKAATNISEQLPEINLSKTVINLLTQLSKIIYDSYSKTHKKAFGVDKKIKSQIREKRQAHGMRDTIETSEYEDFTQTM